MATVPEYRRQVDNRPVNRVNASVRTSGDTFGAGIGRAAGSVATGLASAADAMDAKDELTADAKSREALRDFRYEWAEQMRAPETGYLNRTGGNAVDIQKPAEQRFSELREKYARSLSPRARKSFDAKVDELGLQAHTQLLTHTSNETRNYIENQRQSTIEGHLEDAATNWNDQDLFDRNVGLAMAEQEELARLQGWDDATRKQAAEKLVSGAMKQRIIQAAAVDPIAAQEMFENSREVLNAGDEYALDTNLKGLVIDAKADAFVQGYVRTGGGAGGLADPYAAAVTARESGNDPFAANNPDNPGYASADGTKSSALGLHQMLRGTYLESVASLRRAGGATWAEGMTPAEIAATRTDVAKEGEVFNHFRAQNQAAIRAAGFSVTPETEYAFHHFGAAGGAWLIRTATTNPSAPASAVFGPHTPGILAANPQFKGKTAGEILDWVSSYIGADSATASGQPMFDVSAAFNAALQIEDPEVRARALEKIKSLQVMQDSARSSSREQAQEQAWKEYTETGRTDFGYEMKQAMGQGGWTTFQNAVANDMQGIDQTDPDTWDTLTEASSDPKEFAKVNLEARRPNLSKADWRYFFEQREAARKTVEQAPFELAKEKAALPYAKLHGYADEVYKAATGDVNEKDATQEMRRQRLEFQRQLSQLIGEFFDKEAREPTQPEVRRMAMALTMPTVIVSARGGESSVQPMFNAAMRPSDSTLRAEVDYEEVPYADKHRIVESLTTMGVEITPDAVTERYEQELMMRVGLPPVVSPGQIPEDFRRRETEKDPNISEAELTEAYQSYLLFVYQHENDGEITP